MGFSKLDLYIFENNCNKTISPGININRPWAVTEFLMYSVPLTELQIGIILLMAHGSYFFLARFGISQFICQLLTGIVLGPTVLGRIKYVEKSLFRMEYSEALSVLGMLGFIFHIFLVAVNINVASAKRLTGTFAIVTGVSSVLVPIIFAFVMFIHFVEYFKERRIFNEAMTLIFVQCFSAFSVVVQALKDLKIPNSEIGLLLVSMAMIAGGISTQNLVRSELGTEKGNWIKINSFAYVGFIMVLVFVIRPLMNWIVRRTPAGSTISSSITCTIMMMGLWAEAFCGRIGLTPGIGVYMFGMFVPAGPPLGSAFVAKFQTFNYGVLLPVSIAVTAMRTDLTTVFTKFGDIKVYAFFVIAIGVVKMLSCLVPMLFWRIPFFDSVLFSTIMTSKGTIEMAVYLFTSPELSEAAFSLLILNILVTSLIVAMIVKHLYGPSRNYGGYHDRNVTSLKPDSQLRVLACVHDQDNINSILGFLDVLHPTKERFLVLHVLHLVPLTGFETPMIISHKKNKPASFNDPLLHNLIISFNQYERKNSEGTSISTYTSFSSFYSMNEDISFLAFDHVASLIVCPFHRKWSIHGTIESEDVNIRTINQKLLERAPCSVGIFFDKGKLGRQTQVFSSLGSPLSICTIFLGGNKDDWEALSLAKRTVEQMASRLTIIHFILKNEVPEEDVESTRDNDENINEDKLDAKALEIMMKNYQKSRMCLGNIEYVPIIVNDGPETAKVIRSITDKYDLFVIGRRYGIESPKTSGLSEWVEIPELGIIGDILACEDVNTRAAVLVVQHQKKFL